MGLSAVADIARCCVSNSRHHGFVAAWGSEEHRRLEDQREGTAKAVISHWMPMISEFLSVVVPWSRGEMRSIKGLKTKEKGTAKEAAAVGVCCYNYGHLPLAPFSVGVIAGAVSVVVVSVPVPHVSVAVMANISVQV